MNIIQIEILHRWSVGKNAMKLKYFLSKYYS